MISEMKSLLKLSMLRSFGQADNTAISSVASLQPVDQIWRWSSSCKASQADTCCKTRRVYCSLWFTNQIASNATATGVLAKELSPF